MQSPPRRALPTGERFVAFAFAAGAFRARLGRSPESLVGAAPTELLAVEDRCAFTAALALMPAQGRLAHTSFRLGDRARTPVSVSGLVLREPPAPPRLCLAIALLPAAPELRLAAAAAFLREGEEQLAAGTALTLGVIELAQPPSAGLAGRVGAVLAGDAAQGALAAELGPGRYGLLPVPGGEGLPDLADLARRIGAILAEEHLAASVSTAALALDRGGLSPAQAARALRHGLAAYARAGVTGLQEAGLEAGLPELMARISRRAAGLRRAIAGRRFRLDFQPIVNLVTREVHHREALLRLEPGLLEHGEGPQDFVLLAETIGATEELDLAVAQLALAATPALPGGQRLALNISGLSAQSPAFRDRLLGLLRRDGRATSRIMVELTESAEVEDDGNAAETLRRLRALGVPVCIDDFGAGAAAFRYLKTFPVDYVKVDGAFVTAALTSERDRSFVSAMVDLSLAVGARVIAERVETEEAAMVMHGLGVHLGQGWLFGKPGPL